MLDALTGSSASVRTSQRTQSHIWRPVMAIDHKRRYVPSYYDTWRRLGASTQYNSVVSWKTL